MNGMIDRNPEEMMKYAKAAGDIIGEMTMIIRKIEGLLDNYAKDLDDPTREKIQELHDCVKSFFKQMDTYQNVANSIFSKGKRLAGIRNGGGY